MTPYREAQPIDPGDTRAPTLPVFDASGGRGRDGADGAAGHHGRGQGGHGGPGGDAGPASPGLPGGSIAVTLASTGENGVSIEGVVALANGVKQHVRTRVTTAEEGAIQLVARGGRGGSGGCGGAGGDGARGADGRDATRSSAGSDGGPGGDGGDGGRGSNGGDGGEGGRVSVTVGTDDTHLLMLVTYAIDGGQGGAAGSNGPGGSGGRGGSGGSSCSWTETESYTDSEGRSQTRHHHHSNSGGSDGRSGRGGPPGNAFLVAGPDGRRGHYAIHVASTSGAVQSYASRFELALVRFTFQNDNADGVFEPDEHVTISRIVVRNVGGMPTPTRAPVIYLRANAWVRPDEKTIRLPRPLGPGEEVELEGTLGFHIAMHEPSGPSDPLESEATIDLGAWIPEVNRTFGDFAAQVAPDALRFRVSFPARLSKLGGAFALAAGDRSRVAFSISNISTLALGERSETRRVVRHHIQLKPSEVRPADLTFVDAEGTLADVGAGRVRTLERLGPNETHTIEGTMEFAATAVPYTAARLWVTLGLGRLDLPDDVRIVQVQELVVRVSERYRPNPDADVLLVVQNRTTRDEVEAWRAVANAFGIDVATWDLSLEGHLDLDADVEGGPLSTQFAGKTVVVLDGAFDTPSGERRARSAIDPDQASAFGARDGAIALVGAARHPSFALLLAPDGPPFVTGSSLDGAVAALDALPVSAYARFTLTRSHVFFTPHEPSLVAAANHLSAALDRAYPTRRHTVVHRWTGTTVAAGFVTQTELGTLDVYRTNDVGARAAGAVAATDADIHDPSLVEARLGPMAFAFHLPLARRLACLRARLPRAPMRRLEASSTTSIATEAPDPPRDLDAPFGYLPENDTIAALRPEDWMRWSIAADLLSDVDVWAARPTVPDPDADGRDGALRTLHALSTWDLTGTEAIEPDSPLGGLLIEAVALARAAAWNHVSFLDALPPFLFLRKRPRLYFRVRALASVVFDRAFPPGPGDARARRRHAKRRLAAAFVRLGDLERIVEHVAPEVPRSRALHVALLGFLEGFGVVVESEIASSVVLEHADHDAFVSRLKKREKSRARLRKRHEQARAEQRR